MTGVKMAAELEMAGSSGPAELKKERANSVEVVSYEVYSTLRSSQTNRIILMVSAVAISPISSFVMNLSKL